MTKITQEINNILKALNSVSCGDEFERRMINNMRSMYFLNEKSFPVSDTFIVFKDKEKSEIEKVLIKYYLAGYKKEDISIKFNDSTSELFIEGKVNNKEHFPEGENVKRLSLNASARSFKTKLNINNYVLESASMEDGVLTLEMKNNEEKVTRNIEIL